MLFFRKNGDGFYQNLLKFFSLTHKGSLGVHFKISFLFVCFCCCCCCFVLCFPIFIALYLDWWGEKHTETTISPFLIQPPTIDTWLQAIELKMQAHVEIEIHYFRAIFLKNVVHTLVPLE